MKWYTFKQTARGNLIRLMQTVIQKQSTKHAINLPSANEPTDPAKQTENVVARICHEKHLGTQQWLTRTNQR